MKGDMHSFHMRHKGFINYKRLQSYEVHKPLDHISLVSTATDVGHSVYLPFTRDRHWWVVAMEGYQI